MAINKNMTKSISIFIFIILFGAAIFAQKENTCPILIVEGLPGVQMPGEDISFSAKMKGDFDVEKVQFVWSTDKGVIIDGQGTSSIKVNTKGFEGENITATVEIKGLAKKCGTISASDVSVISEDETFVEILQSIYANDKEIVSKIEILFEKLRIEPETKGYLITYGTKSEIEKQEKLIKKIIKEHHFDINRIVFLSNDEENDLTTEIYIVPDAAVPNNPY